MTFNGSEQLVTYFYNKNLDKFFISFIPFSYINSETNKLAPKIFLVSALILFFCSIAIFFIYFSISSPIKQMVSVCQSISEGNFDKRIVDTSNDELSFLSQNMNHMVEQIQLLLKTQQEQETQKRTLELQMLQYQINPHFLFNTLSTLRLVAAMNKDMVVSDGIQSLSELLKNTLMNTQEYITIQEELKNLKHYLAILSIRYAGSFQTEYFIDETLKDFLVPKLILQPLAENAVTHGLRSDGSLLEIKITCCEENGLIILEVSDNGKGYDLSSPDTPKGLGGLGTKNVNDRIRLSFGESYGLRIQSQPNVGTTCRILLPHIS